MALRYPFVGIEGIPPPIGGRLWWTPEGSQLTPTPDPPISRLADLLDPEGECHPPPRLAEEVPDPRPASIRTPLAIEFEARLRECPAGREAEEVVLGVRLIAPRCLDERRDELAVQAESL